MTTNDEPRKRRPTVAEVRELEARLRSIVGDADAYRRHKDLAEARVDELTKETEELRRRLTEDPEATAVRELGKVAHDLWNARAYGAGTTWSGDERRRELEARQALGRVLVLVGDRFGLDVRVRPRATDDEPRWEWRSAP